MNKEESAQQTPVQKTVGLLAGFVTACDNDHLLNAKKLRDAKKLYHAISLACFDVTDDPTVHAYALALAGAQAFEAYGVANSKDSPAPMAECISLDYSDDL
jgi:hypothetical protein